MTVSVVLAGPTSYPLRMPLALSCCTGSHDTRISEAVSTVALMLRGPAVGSVESQEKDLQSSQAVVVL